MPVDYKGDGRSKHIGSEFSSHHGAAFFHSGDTFGKVSPLPSCLVRRPIGRRGKTVFDNMSSVSSLSRAKCKGKARSGRCGLPSENVKQERESTFSDTFFHVSGRFLTSFHRKRTFSCREKFPFLRRKHFFRPQENPEKCCFRRIFLPKTAERTAENAIFPLFGGKRNTKPKCRFARENVPRTYAFSIRKRGKPPSAVPFESGKPVPADIPSFRKGAGIARSLPCPGQRANTRFPRGRN